MRGRQLRLISARIRRKVYRLFRKNQYRAPLTNSNMESESKNLSDNFADDVDKTVGVDLKVVEAQKPNVIHDAVWGEVDPEQGPNYRGLGFWMCFILATKTQVGLGVLALVNHGYGARC